MINERVDVVAIYYGGASEGKVCIPVKLRYRHQDISLTTLALRHPTTKGKRMIHVFDASDGTHDYRLEFDAERLTWTLVSMIGGA